MINFKTFQSNCKYAQYGLIQDTIRDFELTCRNQKCIPHVHSWGVCDEMHCPHFGVTIDIGAMIDPETGETLLSFNGGRVMFGN